VIGSKVADYRLVAPLGAGGMGSVWMAEEPGGGKVALKVVHPHLLNAPGFERRFLREAELGRAIRHKNVVATLASGRATTKDGPVLYLAMELVRGQTLRALLEEMGRVPEELCRHIGREIAEALRAIHAAGVVHRDLKPENVLITPENVVKVMDLGMARRDLVSDRLSDAGSFAGTVLYAAPEQFTEDRVDGRADLYALGMILYELSAGAHPFGGADVAAVVHRHLSEVPPPLAEVSAHFRAVVATLLQKRPDDRFAGAEELALVFDEGERSAWWRNRGHERASEGLRVGRETALAGREEDLRRLDRLFEEAAAGRGRFAVLEGEAGIGKTRLLDEWTRRLSEEGALFDFLYGSFPPAGAASAEAPFRAAFADRLLDGETLDRCTEATPALRPAFEAFLRNEPPPPGADALTRESLQAVLVNALRELGRIRPTVLCIEDLEFAPEEGRALVAALALAAPGHRLLVLATARPELGDAWVAGVERTAPVVRIRLGRLSEAEVEAILREALGSDKTASELASRVATKSDGNPFFIFEIVRELRAKGFEGGIPIPSSVIDLVRARVAALADDEREILEIAACAGFEFDPGVVAEAAGIEAIPALKRLGRIERHHRLIHSRGRSFLFDHHQVQELLYETLPQALREEYHRHLAESLERRGGSDAEICRHFVRTAAPDRALPRLDAALRELESAHANEAGIDLARRALDLALLPERRFELLLQLAGRLDLAGRREEERAALWEAAAIAERDGSAERRARARLAIARHCLATARIPEAERELRAVLDLDPAPAHRAEALGQMLTVHDDLGRFEEALRVGQEAMSIALGLGVPAIEAALVGNLGSALMHCKRYEEARAAFERQLALAREHRIPRLEATALGSLGNVYASTGRFEEALRMHEEYAARSRAIGFRRGEARARGALAIDYKSIGRYGDALRQYEWYVALSREIGSVQGVAFGNVNQGRLRLYLGDVEGARGAVEAARPLLDRLGAPSPRAFVFLVRAEIAAAVGEPIEEPLREAVRLYRGARDSEGEAETWLLRARARPEETSLGERAYALASWPSTRLVAAALAPSLRAEAERMLARDEGGIEVRARMEALFRLGRKEEARRILASLRENAPEEWRDAMVERVPLHREIWGA